METETRIIQLLGEVFVAVLCSMLALQPGRLRLGGGMHGRLPYHTVPRPNELIIRVVALVIALIVWIDVGMIVTGRSRVLH